MSFPKLIIPSRINGLDESCITATDPVLVERQVSMLQITRIISQISELSRYANSMFEDLSRKTNTVSERIQNFTDRIQKMQEIVPEYQQLLPHYDHKLDLHNQESTIQSSLNFARDSTTEQKMKPEKQIRYMNLFTSETEHPEIKRVLESCEGPPELEKFDKFQSDGVKSLHMFTYPQYFLEEWTKTMLSEYTDTQNKRQLKHSKTRQSKRVNRQSLKTGEIKEIFVKRYNSEGEVVGASKSGDTGGSGSPSEGKPGKSVKLVNNDSDTVNSGLLSPDRPTTTEWSKQLSIPSQPTQNPGSIQQSFAPPPPPPPLPPMMTQSSVNGGGGKKSVMGSEARKEEKSVLPMMVTRKEEKSVENRHNLLNDIRNSQFKLRKVGIQEQETRVKKNEGGVDGVAAILMRRAALEMSDSEESDGEDEGDDDWN